ncbi:MAG: hypothetical protein CL862_02085 [Cyanobium sp. NAT70]|nr:hypothetical protein [Cyanobium sp. NAT70]|tara:strand:+ start:422 stop:892 length:471 start_codon:yes stop_codon:yes gene_type:complete
MNDTKTGTKNQLAEDLRVEGFSEDEIFRIFGVLMQNGFNMDYLFYVGSAKNSGLQFARQQWLKERFVLRPHLEYLQCDDVTVMRRINDCIDYVELWSIAQLHWSVSQVKIKPKANNGMNWIFISGTCDLIEDEPLGKPAKYGASPVLAKAKLEEKT